MANPVSPTPARMALGLLAALLVGTFAALNYRSHSRLIEIQNSGIEAMGRISATQCANHGQMTYRFTVGDKLFSGVGACLHPCSAVRVGTPVKVLYARADPGNSACISLTSRADKVVGNYVSLLLVSVVLGVVIVRVTSVKSSHCDSGC
jgi:hypothetical protein